MLGSGSSVSFWDENWMGERPLKVKLRRLYLNNLDREGKVSDLGTREGSSWVWACRWRRLLFDRELEFFNALLNLIGRFQVLHDEEDKWK